MLIFFLQKYHCLSNSLDPDQAQLFVKPDLGPNSLQRALADDAIADRVKQVLS